MLSPATSAFACEQYRGGFIIDDVYCELKASFATIGGFIMARQKRSEGGKLIKSYEHRDKKRTNTSPVGMVIPETDYDSGQKKNAYQYGPHIDPELDSTAKAKLLSFEVQTLSLYVHERTDACPLIETGQNKQEIGGTIRLSPFAKERKESLRTAVEFYRHMQCRTKGELA